MPQPIEKGEIYASLKMIKRVSNALYEVRCYRCKDTTTVAASSLRKKKVNCRHCYPTLGYKANAEVIYSKRGFAYLEEAAA